MEAGIKSRNSSAGVERNVDEKVFTAILKRSSDESVDKTTLKLKTKPLKNRDGMQIFLTKEDDPAFYYSLDLTDEDFRELRIRQGLLVDLAAFPAVIFRLLDTCLSEELAENPKFFPQLEFTDQRGDEVSFEILEINLYRRLAHLSLKLRKGNDAKVRDHLGDCLKHLRGEHNTALTKLAEANEALKTMLEEKESLEKNLESIQREVSDRDAKFKARLSEEVTEEREKAAQHLAEMRISFENERRRYTNETADKMKTLENRAAAFDYDNRDLTEKKHKNETLIHKLKDDQKHLSEEIQRLKTELEVQRQEKESLGQGNHELDRQFNRLQSRLESVEQEKANIKEELRRRDDVIDELTNTKRHLEQELLEKKTLVTKRENGAKAVAKELTKANEIIEKLQNVNRKMDGKLKTASEIIDKQEEVIQAKEAEIEDARLQLANKTKELNENQTDKEEIKENLAKAKKENEGFIKDLRTKENVIQWLNKQLTTAQARDPGLRLGPPPEGIHFSPSATSTSTPMNAKENKNPGLDPKYFEPSPNLRPAKKSVNKSGLMRKNLASANSSPKQPDNVPQSVYFAKT